MIRRVVFFSLLLACSVISMHDTSAVAAPPAKQNAPSGITVSPAFTQVQITSDETTHPLEFSVTNNRPDTVTLNLSAADFNSLNDTGGLFFVGSNPTKLQKKYGLARWLSLPQSSVTIKPKQTAKITAEILNQSTLSPGGHYGALMLAVDIGSQSNSKNNRVALHPIASSLLFVNKVGGDIHKLKLDEVKVSHSFFSLPSSVTLRFYNDGNTHLIPRGTIILTNPNGRIVKQGTINEDSNIILPEVYRLYTVPLNKIAAATQSGHYKLTVNFRFDGIDQFRSYQASIFILSPLVITVTALLLTAVLGSTIYLYKNPPARKHLIKVIHRLQNKHKH